MAASRKTQNGDLPGIAVQLLRMRANIGNRRRRVLLRQRIAGGRYAVPYDKGVKPGRYKESATGSASRLLKNS